MLNDDNVIYHVLVYLSSLSELWKVLVVYDELREEDNMVDFILVH